MSSNTRIFQASSFPKYQAWAPVSKAQGGLRQQDAFYEVAIPSINPIAFSSALICRQMRPRLPQHNTSKRLTFHASSAPFKSGLHHALHTFCSLRGYTLTNLCFRAARESEQDGTPVGSAEGCTRAYQKLNSDFQSSSLGHQSHRDYISQRSCEFWDPWERDCHYL